MISLDIRPIEGKRGYLIGRDGSIFKEGKQGLKEVKQFIEKNYGFKKVNFYIDKKPSTHLVHLLVWKTFKEKPTQQIVFLDGNKSNCDIKNLASIEELVEFYNKNNNLGGK